MSYSDYISLCFADPFRLHSPDILETLTEKLITEGFRLALFSTELEWDTDPESHLWHAHLYNHAYPDYQALPLERKHQLDQPGITPILEQAIHNFTSQNLEELTIEALGVSGDVRALDFTFAVLDSTSGTDAGVLHPILTRSDDIELYWFHRLPEILYETFHPDFEYLRTEYDNSFFSQHLRKGMLPCLYKENYFGPSLVARIGRERLLTTPDAEVRQLSDGGLHVRLSGKHQAACEHLGLLWNTEADLPLDEDEF